MSDLNDKYKKMLSKDPIIDADQSLNKELHKQNLKEAQDNINSHVDESVIEGSDNLNNEFEYGNPGSYYGEVSKEDVFKISNDNGKQPKKVKRIKSLGEVLLIRLEIIVVFLIIATAICYYLVKTNDNNIVDNPTTVANATTKERTKYNGASLSETYYTNPIKISLEEVSVENFAVYQYLMIDGLKNETIEQKINSNFKSIAGNMQNELLKNVPKAKQYYIHCSCTANFANIISVCYYASAMPVDTENGEYYYTNKFVTYSLIDGEPVKLDDIIAKEAISNILLKEGYNSLALKYSHFDDDLGKVVTENSVSSLEEDVYQLVYDFTNGKAADQIAVSYNEISILLDDDKKGDGGQSIDINLAKYVDKVILFNRYKANDLYDGKYSAIGPFDIFTSSYGAIEKYREDGENYFIDFTIGEFYEKIPNVVEQTISTYCREEINAFIKEASKDKSKYYVLTGYSINAEDYNYIYDDNATEKYEHKGYKTMGWYNTFTTTKQEFKNEIFPKQLEMQQKSSGEGDISLGINLYKQNEEIYDDFANQYHTIYLEIDDIGNITRDANKEYSEEPIDELGVEEITEDELNDTSLESDHDAVENGASNTVNPSIVPWIFD